MQLFGNIRLLFDSPRIASALAVLILFIAFWPLHENGFVRFDDDLYITHNPWVNTGLTFNNIKWAFSDSHTIYWHPLTWISHMLDVSMFGMRAQGHHLINLLIHILNTILLLIWFRRLSGSPVFSFFIAVLWAIHPLRVESIAWAAERKDLLCGFFWLSTLLFYAWYAKKPVFSRYGWVVFVFILGLLSKPMIISLPFVLLLMDFWPLRRIKGLDSEGMMPVCSIQKKCSVLIAEKIPLIALVIAVCIITYNLQDSRSVVVSMNEISLPTRLYHAMVSYMFYMQKMIAPFNLTVFYPYTTSVSISKIGFSAFFLSLLTILAFVFRKKRPWFLIGWLWFLGTMVPVIGIIQAGQQAYADRFTYIPSIGLFVILLLFISKSALLQKQKLMTVPILIITAMWLGFLTFKQVHYWKNCETLFAHSIEVTADNVLAYNNIAVALIDQNRFGEAHQYLRRALLFKPDFLNALQNIGLVFEKTGFNDSALLYYRKYLAKDSSNYSLAGKVHLLEHDTTNAIKAFEKAAEREKNNPVIRRNLAILYNYASSKMHNPK